MSKHFFHPLGDNAGPYTRFNTYSGHGIGNLDYSHNITTGTPVYAICTGEIVYCGKGTTIYSQTGEPNTYCVLKCSPENNALNETFYIRYLHGDYTVKKGDKVEKGTQIGTIASHGNSTGPHLHIDFTYGTPPASTPADYPRDPAVAGSLSNDDKYFIHNNKQFLINDNVDISLVKEWRTINGGGTDIGYCWLMFAQDYEWKEPSVGPEGGITIDKTVYDNNPHWENDNQDGVTAYYTRTMKDSFLGPVPETWEIYQSNACRGFRAAVSIVMHEYAGFGPFISQVWAKILRAVIIGYSLFHPDNASTLDEWLYNVMNNHEDWVENYNYNSPDGHWCSKENLELMFGNEALPFLKAYYYNLKYPNIYGSELSSKATGSTQPNALENIIKAAYKIMNGACVAANGYWSIASGAYFMVNWDPDTGKDEGKVPDPSGAYYSGHMGGMRGTTYTGGGTIDTCYEEYLE